MNTQDVKDFLEQFEDTINVTILEDNKYEHSNYVMLKSDLLYEIDTKNLEITGIGTSEFSVIKMNGTEYTFQISDFALNHIIGI